MASLEELQKALNERANLDELQAAIPRQETPDIQDLPEVGGLGANELGITTEQALKLTLGFIVEKDEAKRGQIFQQVVPGLKAETDDDENVILTFPNGKQASINRPGVSGQDFAEVLAIAPQIFLALRGGAGGRAVFGGQAGQVAGVTAAVGATSVAEDIASGQLGSEREVSLAKAGTAASLALLFEAAGPFVFAGLKRVFEKGKDLFLRQGPAQTLQLTDEGAQALRQLGFDPDQMTPQTLRELQEIVGTSKTSEDFLAQATRVAEGRGLNISITKGQATQSARDQAFERAASKEVFGEQAAGVIRSNQEVQREAIESATAEVSRRLGGAGRTPGDGIEVVRAKLRTDAAALKAKVKAAYDTAGERGAQLLEDGVTRLAGTVRSTFDEDFGALGLSRVDGVIKELEGIQGSVSVKRLENIRKQLALLARKGDDVEKAAAAQARNAFDEALGLAVDDALIAGDIGAVAAFKQARGLAAELQKRFRSDKLVQTIIKEGDDATLLLTPQEAMNRLFGAATLGNKEGSARAIQKIQELLGPNSPEWAALKEEAVLRLLRPTGVPDELPGRLLRKRLAQALDQAPRVVRTLFSKEELNQIGTLGTNIDRINRAVPGAENFSNTTIVNRLINDLGFGGRAIRSSIEFSLRPFIRGGAQQRATQAVQSPLGVRPQPGRGLGAVVGPAAGPPLDEALP